MLSKNQKMKRALSTLLIACTPLIVGAQNLLANGGFEEVNTCEEYNAKCAPEAWFRIPPTDVNVNTRKINAVFEGNYSEIIVVENKNHPKAYRVFLYTKLFCPLIKNEEYTLTFYLNPIFQSSYELGVLFSEKELISGVINPLDFEPSLVVSEEVGKKEKNQWKYVEINYKAQGDEKFLTFGNFNSQAINFGKKDIVNNRKGDLIYLIDSVALVPRNVEAIDCNIDEAKKPIV